MVRRLSTGVDRLTAPSPPPAAYRLVAVDSPTAAQRVARTKRLAAAHRRAGDRHSTGARRSAEALRRAEVLRPAMNIRGQAACTDRIKLWGPAEGLCLELPIRRVNLASLHWRAAGREGRRMAVRRRLRARVWPFLHNPAGVIHLLVRATSSARPRFPPRAAAES